MRSTATFSARGPLSQTRLSSQERKQASVPVLSHWQRSFVALHAAKPNTVQLGTQSAIGDADEVFSDHCAKHSFTLSCAHTSSMLSTLKARKPSARDVPDTTSTKDGIFIFSAIL